MKVPALALLTRALREDARSGRICLARLVFLMFLFLSIASAQAMRWTTAAPGLTFLQGIMGTNLFIITLAGAGLFATAITEEKEARTLGLLRMTALSPVALLLGKSTARMITAILLLAAQFPFVVLAVTLGGVSWWQILAAYCMLVAYVVMLSNIALFWSVLLQRTGNAAGMTLVTLFAMFTGPHIVLLIAEGLDNSGLLGSQQGVLELAERLVEFTGMGSPFTRVHTILATGFTGFPISVQVMINVAVGVVFFVLAWLCFDRFTRVEKDAAPSRGLVAPRTSRIRFLQAGRAWRRALVWKDFHFVTGGKGALLAEASCMVLGVTAATALVGEMTDQASLKTFGQVCMLVGGVVFVVQLVFLAGRIFSHELEEGALPQIMMLPRSTWDLVLRKAMGCVLTLIPAAGLFIGGGLLAPDSGLGVIEAIFMNAGGWYAITVLTSFVSLVAFLSLRSQRTATPLALAVAFVGNMMLMTVVNLVCFALAVTSRANAGDYAALICIGILGTTTAVLCRCIRQRLETVAGQM